MDGEILISLTRISRKANETPTPLTTLCCDEYANRIYAGDASKYLFNDYDILYIAKLRLTKTMNVLQYNA